MTVATYDAALARVLAHEGGYTNHPSDPGGPTNFGITIADYAEFKGRKVTAAEVRAMPLADAKAIYRAKYWARLRCDELPAGLDYALFDYGVNSGLGRAGKVLRRLLVQPDDDWRLTDAVLAAVRKRDAKDLIARLCDERLAFLKRLKTWPVFGAGWGRRVAEVRAAALRMATHGIASSSEIRDAMQASGKGVVPVNASAQKTSATGIAAVGVTAVQQAHQAGVEPVIVVAIIIVAGLAAVVAWNIWHWRQRLLQES